MINEQNSDSNEYDGFCIKGNQLVGLKQYKQAILSFYKAINLSPTNEGANLGIAICLHEIGSLVESIDYFDNALKTNPHSEDALVGKAR